MRVEDYIESLPKSTIQGDDIEVPEHTIRAILDFADIQEGGRFCHLGCGRGEVLSMAQDVYGLEVYGIDNNPDMVAAARERLGDNTIHCGDVLQYDIPTVDAILFWFTDPNIAYGMVPRMAALPKGVRIITIWGPLPGCLPDAVRFPYVMCHPPFRDAPDMASQLRAVLGVKCVSYATAWEFAERYTKAIQPPNAQNDRFLTILQALTIWCSAHSMSITCEPDIPPPVRTYMAIMRNHFGIEFDHLLESHL